MQDIVDTYQAGFGYLPRRYYPLERDINKYNALIYDDRVYPTEIGKIHGTYYEYYGVDRPERAQKIIAHLQHNDMFLFPHIPINRRLGTLMTIRTQTYNTVSRLNPNTALFHDIYMPFLYKDNLQGGINKARENLKNIINIYNELEKESIFPNFRENEENIREEEENPINNNNNNNNNNDYDDNNFKEYFSLNLRKLLSVSLHFNNVICCSCPDFRIRIDKRPCKHMIIFRQEFGLQGINEFDYHKSISLFTHYFDINQMDVSDTLEAIYNTSCASTIAIRRNGINLRNINNNINENVNIFENINENINNNINENLNIFENRRENINENINNNINEGVNIFENIDRRENMINDNWIRFIDNRINQLDNNIVDRAQRIRNLDEEINRIKQKIDDENSENEKEELN